MFFTEQFELFFYFGFGIYRDGIAYKPASLVAEKPFGSFFNSTILVVEEHINSPVRVCWYCKYNHCQGNISLYGKNKLYVIQN